jgi:hypothetical protein
MFAADSSTVPPLRASQARSLQTRLPLPVRTRSKDPTLPLYFQSTAQCSDTDRQQVLYSALDNKRVRNSLSGLHFKSLYFQIRAHSFAASPLLSLLSQNTPGGVCTGASTTEPPRARYSRQVPHTRRVPDQRRFPWLTLTFWVTLGAESPALLLPCSSKL